MSDPSTSDPDVPPPEDQPEELAWKLPLGLFVATVLSTLYVGGLYADAQFPAEAVAVAVRARALGSVLGLLVRWLGQGASYAGPLLGILLCHEFGHYIMARRHRVPASLPMFIPVPFPPFGTMGAVIRMRGRIRTRDALLDIGAAGPLAGLAVALPTTLLGLVLSPVKALEQKGSYTQEGVSLLYAGLKWLTKGVIPPTHDVFLHPVALAGWVGLFVTMVNLIPYGQLDGGHVAYALVPEQHDRWAPVIPKVLLALGVITGIYWGHVLQTQHRDPWAFGTGYTQGFNWFMFAGLIWVLHRSSDGKHPPTDVSELSPRRRWVARLTLGFFVLLFMPVPLRVESFGP